MTFQQKVLLQADNVSKRYYQGYEPVNALRSVSLSVYEGELLSIVGPSGSGKTTLTHILGGLIQPDEGSITIKGQELQHLGDRALSHYRNTEVGFVFQNFSLIPYYTSLENVILPLIVAKVSLRKRREAAEKYLRLVGLEKKINQRTEGLSGGERQRVCIARALVNKPNIIIADEPTGSLDSTHGNEIMTALETLSHKQHVTVVMVTHDESLAARADRIVHIKDGSVFKEEVRRAIR